MIKVTKLFLTGLFLLCMAANSYAGVREPVFISMPAHAHYTVQEALNWYTQQYKLPRGTSFRLLNTLTDELGYTHYRYIQTYNGIDIHSTMWLLHVKGDYVESMNGMVADKLPAPVNPSFTEADGLANALQYINASTYKWEVASEEQFIKQVNNDPKATWFPKGQLMWVSTDINNTMIPFKLCYAFDIYAQQPMSRKYVFVDAQTGSIVWSLDRIHTGNVKDTAKTVYSGKRVINADSISTTVHILNDSSRGAHIRTLNMQQGTSYGSAIDFTNSSRFWFDSNAVWDQYATDAHWATEMTYDFYKKTFNRNSVDNAGHTLFSYVHYSTTYYNAFWDGNEMTYGDGYAQPLTALDITGHEISHGVTQYTAALNYINESGALNEGFSDCMGKSVEHFARSNRFSWPISDDLSTAFRDMSNPKSHSQATTYKGTYWYTGSGDNGGVHQNNSILTYWYYLLCVGGSGTNDNGDTYTVHRLGIDTVQRILYRAQSVYNVPSTQYKDARVNTIHAAGDLYGRCSSVYREVTNAWHAVGVGAAYVSKVVSVPAALRTNFCSLPAMAHFTASNSMNADTFKWYFGDGDSSTMAMPDHQYKAAGKYTVRLKADGGLCGSADSSATNLIVISLSTAPTAKNDTLCGGGKGTLSVTGGSSNFYAWYDSAMGGTMLDTGGIFNTPVVTSTTTFYVEQGTRSSFMKPLDTTFGTGSVYPFSSNHGLIFDALSNISIKSVLVFSDTADYREIDLIDSAANVITTLNVYIPAGGSRVALNMFIPKGTGYELMLNGNSTTRLYRSKTGATYPYSIPGAVSITGNDLGSSYGSYYYFFYNWEVQTGDCRSARGPAAVVIPSGSSKATISASGSTTFCTGGSVKLTASSGSAYKWSTGDTSRSITTSIPGTYNVDIAIGTCNVYSAYDTIKVLPIPTVSINPSGPVDVCIGHTTTLTAITGVTKYKWNTGDSTQTIKVGTAGTYKVYVSNGYCASNTDSVSVVSVSAPTAMASAAATNTEYAFKFVNKSLNGTSYYWRFSNGGFSTASDSLTYTYSGGYPKTGNSVTDTVVLIATNNGCSDTIKIPIMHTWYSSGTIDIANGINMQLYPNPTDRGTNIILHSTTETKISVAFFDATGRLVKNIFDGKVENGEKIIYLDTKSFSSGLYILKVTANGGNTQFNRVIINH